MILDSKILIPYLDLEIGFNVQFSIGLSMQILMNQNICITKETIYSCMNKKSLYSYPKLIKVIMVTYFKFEIKISALIKFGYLSLYITSSYINQYTYARKSLLF